MYISEQKNHLCVLGSLAQANQKGKSEKMIALSSLPDHFTRLIIKFLLTLYGLNESHVMTDIKV